jgi:hypothetical protein
VTAAVAIIDVADVTPACLNVVVYGVELQYPELRRRYDGAVVRPAGSVFVSSRVLEELTEADNTWGMGGAYLLDDHVEAALVAAGLVHIETRGGVYTDGAQRKVLHEIIALIHRDIKETRKS